MFSSFEPGFRRSFYNIFFVVPDEHVPASLVLRKLCTKKSRWFSFILVLKFSSSWVLNSETVVMLA